MSTRETLAPVAYDPAIHHRRSIRLKGYDYSQNGAYFITICTQYRRPRFGHIVRGEMHLSPLGTIVRDEWLRTAELRPTIEIDAFIVMPDHFHGILVIESEGKGTQQCAPIPHTPTQDEGRSSKGTQQRAPAEAFGKPTRNSIPTIVRGFKAAVTNRINTLRITEGVVDTPEKIWQRGYYERIVRDEAALNAIRNYIINNPIKWDERLIGTLAA